MSSRIGVKAQDVRSSALWGRGGRTRAALLAFIVIALALPAAGAAGGGNNGNGKNGQQGNDHKAGNAVVSDSLLTQAQADPSEVFPVIVQGSPGRSSENVGNDVQGEINQDGQDGEQQGERLKRTFRAISGVAADLTGEQILKLARSSGVAAITPDIPVETAGYVDSTMWPASAGVTPLFTPAVDPLTGLLGALPQAPAVAVVDSGIDATKAADFGARIVANVNLSSLSPNATGDAEGHGTMVAGILAGSSATYPGAAPNAPIVSLRTADATGQSMVSDVIAAADWILANRHTYNIRVANFSLAAASPTTFRFDPLDRAVERLWFNGVVVLAAAGNHGTGTGPVDMSFAPGNDPFVITVGALDQMGTSNPLDDTVPWWSAYGHSMDGFSKPDLAAPGRYMVAPVPMTSTLVATVPDRVVAPGYMWMSGTSFATPVVAGAAAQILARHPEWTPDQVKGALMLTSHYLAAAPGSGAGEIDAAAAASLPSTPPNPNENLDVFVRPDPVTGAPTFDQASWVATVQANASWSSASWSSASWSSASWSSASWSSASWSSASWSSASWSSASWSSASWSENTFAP